MAVSRGALQTGRPNVAAVVVDGLSPAIVRKALSIGADLIELRVDTFADRKAETLISSLSGLRLKFPRLPIILTVRSKDEGGKYAISDSGRRAIFEALMPYVDIVDVELSSSAILKYIVGCARERSKKVIISHHNFKTTPSVKALNGIIARGERAGADIVKIAAFARGTEDLGVLAGLLAGRDNLIVIAMGAYGRASRVFFPMIGSLVTYGSITNATAPGQLTLKEIKKEFARYKF